MKRLISLLLAIVLCFGVLASISFAADKPDECAPESAVFVVTHEGDPTAKYYFDSLTTALIEWACKELAGHTTITLTKDHKLSNTGNGQIRHYIPRIKGDWYGSDQAKNNLIFDLGGHTLSYTGEKSLFRIERYGITVKNGTIDYDSIRPIFSIGSSTDGVATTTGSAYAPVLNLEDVQIINRNTGAASSVIVNNMHKTTVNVKDSTLWAAKKTAIEVSKSDQSGRGSSYKEYTGAYTMKINLENSVVGSGGTYPIDATTKVDMSKDTVAVNLKNSTLATNAKSGLAMDAKEAVGINANGVEPTVKEDWSQMLRTGSVTATAHIYGETGSKLPFTDVAESAWYFTFVRDLYSAGIISGMTATTFAPEGTLTYGQALKLITLAVGAPEQAATDAHWASGYLNYALGQGWLYNEVGLDAKISRLQFCQIAAAAAGISDQPASNPFKDTDDGAVLALYNAGIINGMSEDSFSPDSSLTRAQISKIICGIIK